MKTKTFSILKWSLIVSFVYSALVILFNIFINSVSSSFFLFIVGMILSFPEIFSLGTILQILAKFGLTPVGAFSFWGTIYLHFFALFISIFIILVFVGFLYSFLYKRIN